MCLTGEQAFYAHTEGQKWRATCIMCLRKPHCSVFLSVWLQNTFVKLQLVFITGQFIGASFKQTNAAADPVSFVWGPKLQWRDGPFLFFVWELQYKGLDQLFSFSWFVHCSICSIGNRKVITAYYWRVLLLCPHFVAHPPAHTHVARLMLTVWNRASLVLT